MGKRGRCSRGKVAEGEVEGDKFNHVALGFKYMDLGIPSIPIKVQLATVLIGSVLCSLDNSLEDHMIAPEIVNS